MSHNLRTASLLMAISFTALGLASAALAQEQAPKFAGIFTDHAVLQRGEPVAVWGTAAPAHSVTVSLNGQSVNATADSNGKWKASLPAMAAGGPYALAVNDGRAATTLNDIMLGDVFLCSGQSNMEFALKYATNSWGMTQIAADNNLRYITVQRDSAVTPLSELGKPAAWQTVGPQTGDVSAVCYHMSKAIAKDQGVAVGMIDIFWGGTVIQAWVSADTLRTVKGYAPGLDALASYATSPDETSLAWAKATRNAWQDSEPDAAAKVHWIEPKFDDSGWKTVTPDGIWENAGDPDLVNFDGIVWYRQTVTLTKAQAKAATRIALGAVDDADVTWVNGVMVGGVFGWDTPRDYAVPAGTFTAGKNVIVVRAIDTGGGGGLWGKPSERKIVMADGTSLLLPAVWKYKISGTVEPGASISGEPWSSPNGLTNLYNAMIAPVTPYTLKGVAWYQGEANVNEAQEYATLLPAMMKDWRRHFAKPDLPFLIVQLADYGPVAVRPGKSGWAALRESQRLSVNGDAHAGLAVSMDVGDRTDIHPTQKTVVGQRLARAALSVIYGRPVSAGGPDATHVTRSGSDLIVSFRNTQGKLQTYSSDTAIGFEVCSASDVCRYAPAVPDGDRIILKGANNPDVISVRYAWADSPYTNLYSGDDLPAVPFQMDVPK